MPFKIDNFENEFNTIWLANSSNHQALNIALSSLLTKYADDFSNDKIYLKKILFSPDHPDINLKDLTLLHLMISIGNVEGVKQLVDHQNEYMKIPRNINHSSTNNALHYVGRFSKPETTDDPLVTTFNANLIAIAKILSDKATPDCLAIDLKQARDNKQLHKDGDTFPHSIAIGGSLEVMKFAAQQQENSDFLAQMRAVLEVQRNDGAPAFRFAMIHRHSHILRYVSQYLPDYFSQCLRDCSSDYAQKRPLATQQHEASLAQPKRQCRTEQSQEDTRPVQQPAEYTGLRLPPLVVSLGILASPTIPAIKPISQNQVLNTESWLPAPDHLEKQPQVIPANQIKQEETPLEPVISTRLKGP